MQIKQPAPGDIILTPVTGKDGGYIIERVLDERSTGKRRERVATEDNRLAALEAAKTLAKESGVKAWVYDLDSQYYQL